jgi:hypothetical protein
VVIWWWVFFGLMVVFATGVPSFVAASDGFVCKIGWLNFLASVTVLWFQKPERVWFQKPERVWF